MGSVTKIDGSGNGARETEHRSELKALRALVSVAAGIFDYGAETKVTPEGLLREALKTVRDELDVISESCGNGLGGPSDMHFIRTQNRIDLALAVSEYWVAFGVASETDSEKAVSS